MRRPWLALAVSALLAGCTMQMHMVGHTGDDGIVLHGSGIIDAPNQTSTFQVAIDHTDIVCHGTTRITQHSGQPFDIGAHGALQATCSDGRTAKGTFVIDDTSGGHGTVHDDCGNKMDFLWSLDQNAINTQLAAIRAQAKGLHGEIIDKCDVIQGAPPHRDPLI